MVARGNRCDPSRLASLLANELDAGEQLATAQHLESCHRCQSDLQELAGEPSWWQEASRFLAGPSPENDEHRHCSPSDQSVHVSLDFLEPSENPAMLGTLGDYEILERIGQGGMGLVLKGYQRELNRYVAIKVMAPHFASSGAARKRFAREAQAAAAVVHPHVVAIHSVNAGAALPYLVMPFVPCRSLQKRIDDEGPLEFTEAIRIGRQIAAGLAAAHAQGLVHRDVKPANILLEDDVGRVQLTDFGLARAVDDAAMTRSGVIAGTPQFMSPEQASGETVDYRADLFGLGSVLYAMCAGHSPFRAETTMGVLRRICEDKPRPLMETNPQVPAWLNAFIERLHEKDPARRLQSAAEVARLLEQCSAHVQQPAIVSLPEMLRPQRPGSRLFSGSKVARPFLCLMAVVLIAMLSFLVARSRSVPREIRNAGPALESNGPDEVPAASAPIWRDEVAERIHNLRQAVDLLQAESKSPWAVPLEGDVESNTFGKSVGERQK